jgi:hypothetical protein
MVLSRFEAKSSYARLSASWHFSCEKNVALTGPASTDLLFNFMRFCCLVLATFFFSGEVAAIAQAPFGPPQITNQPSQTTPGQTVQTSPPQSAKPPPPAPPPLSAASLEKMDIGKMVGAATAPVNLIIAAAIAISFLVGKQAALAAKFEAISQKFGEEPDQKQKLQEQLDIYIRRLKLTNWAARTLAGTVMIFIVTVLATLFAVVFPDVGWIKAAIGVTMILGLLLMFIGFILELFDGAMAARTVGLEMKYQDIARKKQSGS